MIGLHLLNIYNSYLKKLGQKGVYPDLPYLDVYSTFPEAKLFEENYSIILDEYLRVLQSDYKQPSMIELGLYGGNSTKSLLPWNKELVKNAPHEVSIDSRDSNINWKSIFLKLGTQFNERNCELFPETTKLLKGMPRLFNVFFSYLGPNTTLAPHYGYMKGYLRYHLGLVIPKDQQCYLTVNNIKHYWEEGKSVVFDDMFLHSACNPSNDHRVILYADFNRPLPQPYDFINQQVISLGLKYMEMTGQMGAIRKTIG